MNAIAVQNQVLDTLQRFQKPVKEHVHDYEHIQRVQNLLPQPTLLNLTNKMLVKVKNHVPYRLSFTTHACTDTNTRISCKLVRFVPFELLNNSKQQTKFLHSEWVFYAIVVFCVLCLFVCTDEHKVSRVNPKKQNHKNAVATNWNQSFETFHIIQTNMCNICRHDLLASFHSSAYHWIVK